LIQGEGGVNNLPIDEVKKLANFLKNRDILLIVDEVQTGVYRTGEFLASNIYGIEPDIVTLAKGLGGGVPIGAMLTTKKAILSYGEHGSTFGGNYLAAVAANTVLSILESEYKNHKIAKRIEQMGELIDDLVDSCSIFKEATGIGLMRGIRVDSKKDVGEIVNQALNQKVLVLKSGRNTLRFLPPLTICDFNLAEGFARLAHAIGR
jgi:acetylornithine aminotransferase